MGKSNYKKSKNATSALPEAKSSKPLSMKQRNEVNDIVKKLLKLTSQPFDEKLKWEIHLEIEKLLEKVQKIEAVFNIVRNREDHFPNLITWIKENGGKTENVSIKKFDKMEYGLEAMKDLEENELICSVPRKVMMTLENIKDSPLNYLFENDFILKNMGNIALALFLILEFLKGEKSFWYSYISSLPPKYNTVLYFTTNDFLELKCSPTFDPAIKHYKSIARQYAYFNNLFQSSNDEASLILRNNFTYQLYRWAVSTVMTRQNFVPSKEADSPGANSLIPLWDMCNHTNGYLSTEYQSDGSECFACKPFKKGEQVLIFYGKRSNLDFFVHNGFVYEENQHDTYRLLLRISKSDKLHDSKCELLKSVGIPDSGYFHLNPGSEPAGEELLAYLRIFNMDADELNRWKVSDRSKELMWKDCALIDAKLDSKVWNFLFNRVKLIMKTYDQSVETDVSATSESRHLVRTQLSLEKKFLESALECIRQKIDS